MPAGATIQIEYYFMMTTAVLFDVLGHVNLFKMSTVPLTVSENDTFLKVYPSPY